MVYVLKMLLEKYVDRLQEGAGCELQRFLTKYVNWASVKEDTITAYTQEFTEPELKKLTEFYKTPLGKKASEKMP